MNHRRTFLLVSLVVLPLLAYVRFLSMAGLQFEDHGKVLAAYLQSPTRILIFGIQFLGIGYLLIKCLASPGLAIKALALGSLLLVIVSAARYAWPIFIVSTAGDLIAIKLLSGFLRDS